MEQRGFTVIGEGRLALSSQSLFQMDSNEPPSPIPGGAPFVTFVRQGGALGLTSPVTYIRIPWTPYQVNRARLMDLRFGAKGMIAARHASWVEEVFRGERFLISLSFNDVRQRALFPLYFEHRDRLVRLAEDPSQLMVNFADAGHVKIDSVTPPATRRHLSETLDSTEVVSLFLDRSEGITPQVLTVQFGYFSGWRAWAPVIIPALFFLLGNLAGPLHPLPRCADRAQPAGPLPRRAGPERLPRSGQRGRDSPRDAGPDRAREDHVRRGDRACAARRRKSRSGSRLPSSAPSSIGAITWCRSAGPSSRGSPASPAGTSRTRRSRSPMEREVVRDVQVRVRRARLAEPGP